MKHILTLLLLLATSGVNAQCDSCEQKKDSLINIIQNYESLVNQQFQLTQRLYNKLEAAYNILSLINVNGYVTKKNMPEFRKARDYYINLNNKK